MIKYGRSILLRLAELRKNYMITEILLSLLFLAVWVIILILIMGDNVG